MAASAVLLFHSLHHFESSGLHPVLAVIHALTFSGWLGVHVFFALSGWCIAERLAAATRRNEAPLTFLRERFLRIYPAYWAALFIAIGLRVAAGPINRTPFAANVPASGLAWFGDLSLLHPALGTTGFLLVSWTLFCELGFYLAAGLALGLVRGGVPRVLLLLVGAAVCFWPLVNWRHPAFLPLELWPEFYIGVIAWWAARRGQSVAFWASLSLFIAASLLIPGRFQETGNLIALAVAALLFLCARHPMTAPPRLLVRCASLGAMSYSLYLIHVPVLSPLINLAVRFLPVGSNRFLAAWAAAVTIAFAAGWLFYRLVEAPCERWRRQHNPSRVAS